MRRHDVFQLIGGLIVALGLGLMWYPFGIVALGGVVFMAGILMEQSKGGVHGAIESDRRTGP